MFRKVSKALLALLVLATVVPATVAHAAGCAGETTGGDWNRYGHTLGNDRNQSAETKIGSSNVDELSAAWGVTASGLGGLGGAFQSTVAIADGCVYATTSNGSIAALNADTGEVVWHVQESPVQALAGLFAPTVVDGIVYVIVGQASVPYVVALDALTGAQIWRTNLYHQLLDAEPTYLSTPASIVYFDGLLFVPLTGSDLATFSHPSFYILRAFDGAILKKTNVIDREHWANMYAGGGIWTTGVVDEETKHIYVGTSNPYNKRQEHPFTNAILKIDIDQKRNATFGEIVSHYKGDNDFTDEAYFTTECELLAEAILIGFSAFCGQIDVDFGASPNLYKHSDGRTVVAELQKSCTFHAVDAKTMEVIWKQRNFEFAGANSCSGTSAYDENGIYVGESDGMIHAFNKDDGTVLWESRFAAGRGGHYTPISVANGVVYTLSGNRLFAADAATGAVLVNAPMVDSAGNACNGVSAGGIAIARNTLYAACDAGSSGGGVLFAYRLP